MIQREAAMLAFIKSFRLLGALFFAMIPLVFLMRKPRHKAGPGAGVHSSSDSVGRVILSAAQFYRAESKDPLSRPETPPFLKSQDVTSSSA